MKAPKYINDVQKLNGQVITLGRFISYLAKRYLSFFKALKGKINLCEGEGKSVLSFS